MYKDLLYDKNQIIAIIKLAGPSIQNILNTTARFSNHKNNHSFSGTLITDLIFLSISLFDIVAVHSNLLIILLKSSHILSSLGKLSLLHSLPNIPMDEGSLGVHQVKLMVQSSPGLRDGGSVGEHTYSPLHLCKISARDDGGGLIVDPNLEPSGTPVNELDTTLGLDRSNGGVDVLGNHISPVEHAAGHVLAVPRVALDHGVGRLETGVGDLRYAELLMIGLLGGNDRGVGDKGEMNPGVGH